MKGRKEATAPTRVRGPAALVVLLLCGLMPSPATAGPPLVQRVPLPPGAQIAVIPLRDCVITGQEDCNGSGNSAGSILARVLSASGKMAVIPLSRPVPASQPFSDDDAVAEARSRGFGFVLNGEVDDYYNVAFGTFRSDRAGISIRILRTSDGAVVAFASQKKEKGNYSSPDKIIEGLARSIRDSLRFDSSAQPASTQVLPEPKPAAVTPTTAQRNTSEPASGSPVDGRGVFEIKSTPSGAEVYVDGEFVGTTPIAEQSLAAGRHEIELRKKGLATWKRQLSVSAGSRATVAAEMEPESPAPPTPR